MCEEKHRFVQYCQADTVDTIPPNPVTDLAVTQTTKDSVTLGWTVQADDATHDRPAHDLRYSLEPIDEKHLDNRTYGGYYGSNS